MSGGYKLAVQKHEVVRKADLTPSTSQPTRKYVEPVDWEKSDVDSATNSRTPSTAASCSVSRFSMDGRVRVVEKRETESRQDGVDIETLRGDIETLRGDIDILRGDIETLRGDGETLRGDGETMRGDGETWGRRRGGSIGRLCLAHYQFFDLTNLPLISVLSRRQKTLVLKVSRTTKKDKEPKPIIVKLFATSHQSLDKHSVIAQVDNETESKENTFHREFSCLQRCQDICGVVDVLGWGIAENYEGLVLEALNGPTLHDVNEQFRAPPQLQLLYKLEWAVQISQLLAKIHSRGVVHRDITPQNFAFRESPTNRSFGSLVLFDFDNANFMRRHPTHKKTLPKLSIDESSLCFDDLQSSFTLSALCEELCPEIDVPCLHWPSAPPNQRTQPIDAPEKFYCNGDTKCAQGRCYAEKYARDSTQHLQFHTVADEDECLCPMCECHHGRVDVYALGSLLGEIFDAFKHSSDCPTCGQKLPFSRHSLDRCVDEVNAYIEHVSLASYNIVTDFSNLAGFSSMCWDDETILPQRSGDALSGLLEWKTRWTILSEEVVASVLNILQHATATTPQMRPSAQEVSEVFGSLFTEVYNCLSESELFALPDIVPPRKRSSFDPRMLKDRHFNVAPSCPQDDDDLTPVSYKPHPYA